MRSKTRRGTGAWAQTSQGGGKGKREGAGLGREEKEVVGAGGGARLGRFEAERERRSERAVEEEGADRRARPVSG